MVRVRARRPFTVLLLAGSLFGATNLQLPAALAGPYGHATTIQVFPGKHALAKALAKAHPGDALEVHTGTYKEAVVIGTPNVVVEAAGDGPVTVDGRCRTQTTVVIAADQVTVTNLTVVGATFYEVDAENVGSGTFAGLTVTDTCGTAEYGLNLYETGPFQVFDNVASGFSDSGIYVGGITTPLPIVVRDNESFGNARGIIVEDSANVDIQVLRNNLHDNETSGLHLTNSDGIVIDGNAASNDGTYGIDLDASSDGNQVTHNTARHNTFDLATLGGTGNCFQHNHYKTHQGQIGC